jgi:hypothetical protein
VRDGGSGTWGAPLIVVVALATALAACGSGSSARDGGGSDGAAPLADAAGDSAEAAAACDPAAQNCGLGMKCDFFCDGTTPVVGCRLDPGGGQDANLACSAADYCRRGTGCIAMAATGALCRQYCTTDSDCIAGQCHQSMVGVNCGSGTSNLSLKVCY